MNDINIGLIARADNRGLGTMTWEFHKHLSPSKTLVVLTGDPNFSEFPERFERGDVSTVTLGPNLTLDEQTCREFLDGLDVVYTAETFYDWRMLDWAREMGVKTVCHGMPELCNHARKRNLPHPDEWWWPTDWLLDQMPSGRVIPIPGVYLGSVAADPHATGPLRVVHPGGKEALADRDGTRIFLDALDHVTEDVEATIFLQDRVVEHHPNVPLNVRGPVESRWEMYEQQHLMVLPRRYGGLSLKVHESLDSGVPVILPDIEPNRMWPGPRIKARRGRRILVPCGPLTTRVTDCHALAEEIDRLAADRSLLDVEQRQASEWAHRNIWSHHRNTYLKAFEALM